jgi:DNA end-binding protein Ku
MPRAIWKGAISFGLVNVPVKLYSAVQKKTIRFHQLHDADGVRIQQKRLCPKDGKEVPYDRVVKGYEISPDRYVVIKPEELEAIDPEKTRAIDVQGFVDLEEIDPVYFEHPYYLAPDTGGAKAYKLLLTALQQTNKVAIARVVIRSKEYLAALRPADGVLMMETMQFHDEVVQPDDLDELPRGEVQASDREVDMARQLIESLSTEFEPDKYRDEYREGVLELIQRKDEGQEIEIEPFKEPEKVPDLMAALEASLAAATAGAPADGRAKKRRSAKAGAASAKTSGGGAKTRGSAAKGDGRASGGRSTTKKREKAKSKS